MQEMADEGVELHSEGINFIDYWLARCNIDPDEFLEVQGYLIKNMAGVPTFAKMTMAQKLLTLTAQSFFLGLVYGRTKADDEL